MKLTQKQDSFQLSAQATLGDCELDAGLPRVFLADPGEARGCSINTLVIH